MNRRRYLAPWGRAEVAAHTQGNEADRAKILAALEGKPAIYHCVSRVVDRGFRLGQAEKEEFVRRMRRLERFCRVRILTYCVMSNHFHILVEVPERPQQDPGDAELLEHLRTLYGGRKLTEIRWELEHYRSQGNHRAAEALRQRFLRRMWDLSVFLCELKQGFSRWFNGRNERKGYLWEDRFKSVLVEDGHAARVVAAYIDLNPVRAGMVGAAGDYRWSGYAEAVAGKQRAREGLRQVMLERELARADASVALREVADWKKVLAGYRGLMADPSPPAASRGQMGAALGGAGAGNPSAAKRPHRGRQREGGGCGVMSETEMLRRKVRYFVDGLVIGSKGFVDAVFGLTKSRFSAGRPSGARTMRRVETPLRTMRALRVRSFGE